jgi:archaellum component FlaC
LSSELEILSTKTQALETRIQKIEDKADKNLATVPTKSEDEVKDLLDFIQSEIDELDQRNKNFCHQFEALSEQISYNSKNISNRIQKIRVEVTAQVNRQEKEIQKIRYDVNQIPTTRSINYKVDHVEGKDQDNQPICARCGKVCKSVVRGRVLEDYIFCSRACSDLHHKSIETEGH